LTALAAEVRFSRGPSAERLAFETLLHKSPWGQAYLRG
jgi:hypothetical protein